MKLKIIKIFFFVYFKKNLQFIKLLAIAIQFQSTGTMFFKIKFVIKKILHNMVNVDIRKSLFQQVIFLILLSRNKNNKYSIKVIAVTHLIDIELSILDVLVLMVNDDWKIVPDIIYCTIITTLRCRDTNVNTHTSAGQWKLYYAACFGGDSSSEEMGKLRRTLTNSLARSVASCHAVQYLWC